MSDSKNTWERLREALQQEHYWGKVSIETQVNTFQFLNTLTEHPLFKALSWETDILSPGYISFDYKQSNMSEEGCLPSAIVDVSMSIALLSPETRPSPIFEHSTGRHRFCLWLKTYPDGSLQYYPAKYLHTWFMCEFSDYEKLLKDLDPLLVDHRAGKRISTMGVKTLLPHYFELPSGDSHVSFNYRPK